jgi:acyl-homoserine lactone acylase PvdQ
VTEREMRELQLDVLDVQARESLKDMLYCVDKASVKLSDQQRDKLETAKTLLKAWDFKFDEESSAASIFTAWEMSIAYYLHEKKITSPVIRVTMSYASPVNQFTWLSIKQWAAHMRESGQSTHAEYCAVNEIVGDDCLNFMRYTLIKAVEDIKSRKGKYDPVNNNWRYGGLMTTRKEHVPFTETPLRSFFDNVQEGKGNKRTVNLLYDFPAFKEPYESTAGAVLRFIADFSDHTSIYVTADNGVD